MFRTYARLLAYVRPYALGMGAAVVCMAILSATTAAYTWLSGPMLAALFRGDTSTLLPLTRVAPWMLEAVQTQDRAKVLMWLPLLLLAVAVVKGASYAGQFILSRAIAQRVMADIRTELFGKLLSLPVAFHETRKRGDLMARSVSDVQQVETSLTDATVESIRHAFQIIALVVQAFVLDWRLAALCFISGVMNIDGKILFDVFRKNRQQPLPFFSEWIGRKQKSYSDASVSDQFQLFNNFGEQNAEFRCFGIKNDNDSVTPDRTFVHGR